MSDQFRLTRVSYPGALAQTGDDHYGYRIRETGGQWEWCWAIAMPYQALVAPQVARPMPAAPDGLGGHIEFLGYWACLQSFLTFSFGWSRHDKGLMAWYDAGKPVDDERFALLEQVWDRDAMLERYLEWTLDRHMEAGPLSPWLRNPDSSRLEIDPAWQRRMEHAARSRWLPGGVSPHGQHLDGADHVSGPARDERWNDGEVVGKSELFVSDIANRRAMLQCDSVRGWYRDLVTRGGELSTTKGGTWRIDVFVKPIGFVGNYRRSWSTGLWFAGKHRYHSIGN